MGDVLSPKLAEQLAAWGICMRGKIAHRQTCPVCGQKGRAIEKDFGNGRRAFMCTCLQWMPDKPFIYLKWQDKPYRIAHDQGGRRFANFIEADRALGLIRSQIENGAFYPELWTSKKTNRLLWENYLEDYLAHEELRCTPASMAKKRSLAKHLAWFAGKNIREIRTAHAQDFAAIPCLELALAPKSRADLMAELRHIFQRAVQREDIERAPIVPTVSVPEQPIDWLSPEDQALALRQIPQEHRPIFRFMMYYGCRVNEATALCWDKIDRGKGVFYLSRTFSRRQLIETTKTKRSRPLPIMDFFEEYLDSVPPGVKQTPVFRNPQGRSREGWYTQDFLLALWLKASEAAGIPLVHLKNATRHSRGMQALNLEDWPEEDVALLFGHTSTQHTKKYARPEISRLRRRLGSSPKVATLAGYRDNPSISQNEK